VATYGGERKTRARDRAQQLTGGSGILSGSGALTLRQKKPQEEGGMRSFFYTRPGLWIRVLARYVVGGQEGILP